ncbi:transcription factor bHLH162-like [Lotus japonicus]|uniref:transcription factor bHLH162-like n=1 Tax=Lotus japonicus TaxID=34305 RepID=UPI00258BBC67|nr:transcription factor bHLH162-like [Lotus japonicus]
MKNSNNTSDSPKLDRKTIEKNRRIHMKALCFKLMSSIPASKYLKPTKDMLAQQDQLDLAAGYIKHMREKIDKLKGKKEQAMSMMSSSRSNDGFFNISTKLPLLEIRDLGSAIEVMLITGLNKNFMLYQVICVLEEEGVEVVTANFSTISDKIFYTIHAKVKISRLGVEPTRVYQRLQELISPIES